MRPRPGKGPDVEFGGRPSTFHVRATKACATWMNGDNSHADLPDVTHGWLAITKTVILSTFRLHVEGAAGSSSLTDHRRREAPS